MTASLSELCQRARPELACLGELGRPLLEVVTVVERRAAGRDDSVLADPVFALDVLTAAGPGTDAAVVGRVLDFLRARSGAGPVGQVTTVPTVTIAEAVESYERGALALMARGTQHTYRTWTRRLVADYGDHAAGSVTAGGDLSLHSYRHALGTFTDSRYGRPMTRAVLGHSSRRTPTDHYVHIPLEQVAEVLTAYESHLLDPVTVAGNASLRAVARV